MRFGVTGSLGIALVVMAGVVAAEAQTTEELLAELKALQTEIGR